MVNTAVSAQPDVLASNLQIFAAALFGGGIVYLFTYRSFGQALRFLTMLRNMEYVTELEPEAKGIYKYRYRLVTKDYTGELWFNAATRRIYMRTPAGKITSPWKWSLRQPKPERVEQFLRVHKESNLYTEHNPDVSPVRRFWLRLRRTVNPAGRVFRRPPTVEPAIEFGSEEAAKALADDVARKASRRRIPGFNSISRRRHLDAPIVPGTELAPTLPESEHPTEPEPDPQLIVGPHLTDYEQFLYSLPQVFDHHGKLAPNVWEIHDINRNRWMKAIQDNDGYVPLASVIGEHNANPPKPYVPVD